MPAKKSPIDNFDQEQGILESVVGVSDAMLQQMNQSACADCGGTFERNQMWYVPFGSRAICRTCRNLRLAAQAEKKTPAA